MRDLEAVLESCGHHHAPAKCTQEIYFFFAPALPLGARNSCVKYSSMGVFVVFHLAFELWSEGRAWQNMGEFLLHMHMQAPTSKPHTR